MHLFVRVDKWDRNSYIDKKESIVPSPGRLRERGRSHPRPSRERRAKWGTTSKQHTERRTPSRACRAFTARNLVKIWPLDCRDDMAKLSEHLFHKKKKKKNVSCEHDRLLNGFENQLCELRDTSDTLVLCIISVWTLIYDNIEHYVQCCHISGFTRR